MAETDLRWPFLGLTDEFGRGFGWCGLVGPVRGHVERQQLDELTASRRLIGFTAFLRFPARPAPAGPGERPVECAGWAHCFRSPDTLLPLDAPRVLLALSDFTDPAIVTPDRFGDGRDDSDFVYVCQAGSRSEQVKGWGLARRCLPVLAGQLRLRGMLVGRPEIPGLSEIDGAERLSAVGELPWPELMRCLRSTRFLFVPNDMDPSPRIIAEALSMGTPVLVNRHILGGWHQVNPFTGAFFESAADVAAGARRCLTAWTSPRRWFAAHLGPRRSGERLARLVHVLDPQTAAVRRVHLSYRIDDSSGTSKEPG